MEVWRDWLCHNIAVRNVFAAKYLISVTIVSTLWNIWIARNKFVFDNIRFDAVAVCLKSIKYANEMYEAFRPPQGPVSKQVKLVSWCYPGMGRIKLNVNGSSRGNPRPAGFGGVFRNDGGHWILGYMGRLRDCTAFEADQLWGLYYGLELIKSQGLRNVDIDTNSLSVVSVLVEECPPFEPNKVLMIQECKGLLVDTGSFLRHTLREANQVTDRLANLGVDQEERMVTHVTPPEGLAALFAADHQMVAFERV